MDKNTSENTSENNAYENTVKNNCREFLKTTYTMVPGFEHMKCILDATIDSTFDDMFDICKKDVDPSDPDYEKIMRKKCYNMLQHAMSIDDDDEPRRKMCCIC